VSTVPKKPKHRQIYEFIHNGILAGRYAVGDRIPTEMELADRFDATRLTVARALRDLAREGYLRRRRRVGSFVQEIQTGGEPRRGGGNLLATVLPRQGGIALRDFRDAIAQAAGEQSLGVLTDDIDDARGGGEAEGGLSALKRADALCRHYVNHNVTGVFFVPLALPASQSEVNTRIVEGFRRAGISVVLLDRDTRLFPGRSDFDLVALDSHQAGYLLTSHLVSLAYRRIGFVAWPEPTSSALASIAGYRDALDEAGIAHDPGLIWRGDVRDRVAVGRLLEECRADAFVCQDDEAAAHLMSNLAALGARVPDDVALVGMGDVQLTAFLPVALTTVRRPYERMAAAAVRMMLERLADPDLEARQMQFAPKLVIRESCGAARRRVADDEDRRLLMTAEPVLRDMHRRSGETVNLGVAREGQIIYLSVLESRHPLRRVASPQGVDPLHTTALGRAILCHLPPEEQAAVLGSSPFEKRTPFTETDPERIRAILRQARADGYAVEQDQTDVGVTCVGAPVFAHGRVVAAISVSVPTARVESVGLDRFIHDVLDGAGRVSRLLDAGKDC
jgi:DNA-binding LacI/PurR family transcriptional regulator/DNA-binding IclR family transcriptional regulator